MKKILIPSIVVVSFLFGVAYLYAAGFETITIESSDWQVKIDYCNMRAKYGTYISYDEYSECRDFRSVFYAKKNK